MRIRYIKLDNWDDADASIVLRLMMISNDITMSDHFRDQIKKKSSGDRTEFEHAADSYFMRLTASLIFEALALIPEIQQSKTMRIILNNNKQARQSFERLREYKERGKFDKEFQILVRLWNNGLFHYKSVGKLMIKNLKKRIKDGIKSGPLIFDAREQPIRFVVADQVFETVFTYDILGRKDGEKLDEAVTEIAAVFNNVMHDFSHMAVALVLGEINERFV